MVATLHLGLHPCLHLHCLVPLRKYAKEKTLLCMRGFKIKHTYLPLDKRSPGIKSIFVSPVKTFKDMELGVTYGGSVWILMYNLTLATSNIVSSERT